MIGKTITTEELKARWAYAEAGSSRFGDEFTPHLSPSAIRKIRRGLPFEKLPESQWPEFVAALGKARPREFVDIVHRHGSGRYTCEQWQPTRLLSCLTLPSFDSVHYFRFLTLPPHLDRAGRPDAIDPRNISRRIPFDPLYRVTGPIIAVRHQGQDMLVEGYLRSILWLRNPVKPLEVWVPTL